MALLLIQLVASFIIAVLDVLINCEFPLGLYHELRFF